MKSIGWVIPGGGGGDPILLTGDANGPSNNNTVTAIHADGVQYPFGTFVDGQVLTVSGGQIVTGGALTLTGDANGSLGSNTVDAIHANAVQYPFGTLNEGEVLVVSGGQIQAGGAIPTALAGDANGLLGATLVTSVHADGVPYTLGALANGEALVVSGGQIVAGGPIPTSLAGDAQGSLGSNEVRAIHESGNQQLTIGSIVDGTFLSRSGTSIVGFAQNNFTYRLYGSFIYLDTEVFLSPMGGLPANAIVTKAYVAITEAFDDVTAVVTLGWFGNPEGLLTSSAIKEGAEGTYGEVNIVPSAANQAIQLFISPGGASQGQGLAVVEYILT